MKRFLLTCALLVFCVAETRACAPVQLVQTAQVQVAAVPTCGVQTFGVAPMFGYSSGFSSFSSVGVVSTPVFNSLALNPFVVESFGFNTFGRRSVFVNDVRIGGRRNIGARRLVQRNVIRQRRR
jgi:hypothetical protein